MRVASCVLLLTASVGSASASTTLTGGTVINQTWNVAGSPYVLEGDITVPNGSTLTIEAGTTVQFPGGDMQASGVSTTQVELTVHGALVVQGTSMSPVTFTAAAPNEWYGIIVAPDAQQVVIDHVMANHMYAGLTYQAPGNVMSSFALDLEDPQQYGLYISTGAPAFDGLVIKRAAYNVLVTNGASLALTNCVVQGASSAGLEIISGTSPGTLSLTNCTIDGNGLNVNNDTPSITTVTITNSLLTDGSIGVLGAATVTYSDVWNNTENYASANPGTGCISANPQYVSETDLHLQPSSVAIDSATTGPDHDADDHVRPVDGDSINGAQWDMGAYEYGSTVTPPSDAGAAGHDASADLDGRGSDQAGGGGRSDPAGGCCDSGHGSGAGSGLLVLVLGGVLVRRRRGMVTR